MALRRDNANHLMAALLLAAAAQRRVTPAKASTTSSPALTLRAAQPVPPDIVDSPRGRQLTRLSLRIREVFTELRATAFGPNRPPRKPPVRACPRWHPSVGAHLRCTVESHPPT